VVLATTFREGRIVNLMSWLIVAGSVAAVVVLFVVMVRLSPRPRLRSGDRDLTAKSEERALISSLRAHSTSRF
jgi:hypothetical protein